MIKRIFCGLMLLLPLPLMAEQVFLTLPEVKQLSFAEIEPVMKTLWLTGDMRKQATAIARKPVHQLRVRYWVHQGKTLWLFDEIGKERPITFAVTINDNQVERLDVMVFRESRGGEIKSQGFTRQFVGAGLKEKKLNQHIDGVTGATLSVRASKRAARLALFYHGLSVKKARAKIVAPKLDEKMRHLKALSNKKTALKKTMTNA